MSGADIATLTTTLAAVVAALVAVLAYFAGKKSERKRDKTSEQAAADKHQQDAITTALQPLVAKMDRLGDKVTQVADTQKEMVDKVGSLDREMADTRVKVQVFWEAIAKDAARILHSPHPERFHIDALLEKFLDGSISDAECGELRRYLTYIVDWSHDQVPDFPIFPGDQVAAAILLRTIDTMRRE